MHVTSLLWSTFSSSAVSHCTVNSDLLSRYKFDDERVTKEDIKRALEEQYGGEEEVYLDYIWWQLFGPCSYHGFTHIS